MPGFFVACFLGFLFYNRYVDDYQKLQALSKASELEAGEDGCRLATREKERGIILTRARMSNGRSTSLLKSLLNSACENNCLYCPMRAGRDFQRHAFLPDEFARLVINLTNAGLIQGVFLSSGVSGGGVRTQDRLIDTAQLLRKKYQYQGYLHLKIMPGAEDDQVAACLGLANRVSINLEAPNEKRLPVLAPQKDFNSQLMRPMQRIAEFRRNTAPVSAWKGKWPSICTQFVLGAAGETDRELLETTQSLHRDYLLSRAYFSAFTPQEDTPLAHHPSVPLRRELRLYQADFLIRDYGFNQEDMVFDRQGHLPLNIDPKIAWAERHLAGLPVEINRASKEELLRVPGIGPKSANRIMEARRVRAIRDFSGLGKLGVNARRAAAYILLDGRAPARKMRLF